MNTHPVAYSLLFSKFFTVIIDPMPHKIVVQENVHKNNGFIRITNVFINLPNVFI
jgi:hypothetical protein